MTSCIKHDNMKKSWPPWDQDMDCRAVLQAIHADLRIMQNGWHNGYALIPHRPRPEELEPTQARQGNTWSTFHPCMNKGEMQPHWGNQMPWSWCASNAEKLGTSQMIQSAPSTRNLSSDGCLPLRSLTIYWMQSDRVSLAMWLTTKIWWSLRNWAPTYQILKVKQESCQNRMMVLIAYNTMRTPTRSRVLKSGSVQFFTGFWCNALTGVKARRWRVGDFES